MKIVDLYHNKDSELLKRVYEKLYAPNFSYSKNECESLEAYHDRIIVNNLVNRISMAYPKIITTIGNK